MKLSYQAQLILQVSCLAGVALAWAVPAWGDQLPTLPTLTPQPAASTATDASTKPDAAASTGEQEPEPDVEKQLEQVDEQLRVAKRISELAQDETPGAKAPPEQLRRKEDLLNKKKSIIKQIEASQERKKDLTASRDDLQAQLQALRASDEDGNASRTFHDLEQVRDELVGEQAAEASLTLAADAATDELNHAKSELEEKERQRRRAKDALSNNSDPAKTGKLTTTLELAKLESDVAEEQVKLAELERANEKFALEVHQIRLTYLTEKELYLKDHVTFSSKERDKFTVALETVEDDRRNDRKYVADQQAYYEKLLEEAQNKIDGDETQREVVRAEIEAWKTYVRVQRERMDTLVQRLERLTRVKKIWDKRYRVFNNLASAEELEEWRIDAQAALEALGQSELKQQGRLETLNHERASLKPAIGAAREKNPEIVRWLERQEEALRELDAVYDANMEGLQLSRRTYERLLTEIDERQHIFSIAESFHKVLGKVEAIWDKELKDLPDGDAITVGDIVTGIILLLIGLLLSRVISRWLGRRVFPRVGLHMSASAALQSIIFYSLVVIFTLYALHLVQVPLTVFTFFGGALAIGVGFGSQNIVNNFISGLILLAERPIRIGDVVQIDGLYGTIENIGARSTRVRTATNLEIIVPNSSFLQNNVVNWTLSDQNIRAQINVGVMYGSPTRDVAKLLRRAAEDHGLVLSNPEPFVWFGEFGDNALQFELHFWLEMRNLSEKRRVESDIRFRIDQLFAEAGIVIAYPQRDVHLNGTGPLEVRLLRSNGREQQDADSQERSAA